MKKDDCVEKKHVESGATAKPHERAPYERPQVTKKRSLARVTLFSGSGAAGVSGLTTA
jgi:hypothetical protein